MSDNKRTQRTPQEIIAETEAKLAKLRMKQAKQEAQSNPQVASLMDERNALMKKKREAAKILGSGPQSAEARIAKHEAWIDRISQEQSDAQATMSGAEASLAFIDRQIEDLIASQLDSQASA